MEILPREFLPGKSRDNPMPFRVTRRCGQHSFDFLRCWDVIWGPVWTINRDHAKIFSTYEAAREEAITATEIMRPVPWRTPDFGTPSTVSVHRGR